MPTSAGTSWPRWWNVLETSRISITIRAVEHVLADVLGRLGDLVEAVDVVAARVVRGVGRASA